MPDIVTQRLYNQRLVASQMQAPAEVVSLLGAVQSQDFAGAKWAVGQRIPGATDADLQRAFDAGEILRTHVMRPTWHFVTPADIRWLQMLTAPRVKPLLAYYDRKLELDAKELARCQGLIEKALAGGKQLTRNELAKVLASEGIITEPGQRVGHLLMHAELDAIICSGAMRGKQHTYALLEERALRRKTLTREEALATLTERYFSSHGPATAKDFSWWSGLSLTEAQTGLALVKGKVARETIGGVTSWRAGLAPAVMPSTPAYLLPNFDEFTVAYADRSALYHPRFGEVFDAAMNQLANVMVLDGQLVGLWKRVLSRRDVTVALRPASPLGDSEREQFAQAAARYGEFLGVPATLGPADGE